MRRLFPQAKTALLNGDYEEALSLYKEAGERYGYHVVEAQVALCQEAIGRRSGSSSPGLDSGPVHTQSEWPDDLHLAPLPESTNDFEWLYTRKTDGPAISGPVGLSVVIPTFNRPEILDITLACLANQLTDYAYEVIVADDGSSANLMGIVKSYETDLDIKYVRQKDLGYRLSAVRNLGLRTARFECVAVLDCDMAPNPNWVQCYMELLSKSADVALIGPRRYVDTSGMSGRQFIENPALLGSLPEIVTNNSVAGQVSDNISVDWRLAHFAETQNLRLCNVPFRFFSGGNVAFNKRWLSRAGSFDEAFNAWGGEDIEFGYRLYRAGCFLRAVDGGLAYHQEPPGKENETDREEGKKITQPLVQRKVHYSYRRPRPGAPEDTTQDPLVSIYIPAYNCEAFIEKCVDSALGQSITDLEVCVCDDGSNRQYMGNLATKLWKPSARPHDPQSQWWQSGQLPTRQSECVAATTSASWMRMISSNAMPWKFASTSFWQISTWHACTPPTGTSMRREINLRWLQLA